MLRPCCQGFLYFRGSSHEVFRCWQMTSLKTVAQYRHDGLLIATSTMLGGISTWSGMAFQGCRSSYLAPGLALFARVQNVPEVGVAVVCCKPTRTHETTTAPLSVKVYAIVTLRPRSPRPLEERRVLILAQ